LQPQFNGWVFDERRRKGAANLALTLCEAASDGEALGNVRKRAISTAQHYTLSKIASRYLEDFQEVVISE